MFTLSLTEDEVRIVSDALVNMPFGKVANLIGKLQKQINDQQQQKVTTSE